MGSATRPPCPRRRAALRRSGLDVDALAGALLGGLDHRVELAVGDVGEALGALGVALGCGVDRRPLLDVGETIVEQGEDIRADLLAETVPGAQVLIDPDLHRGAFRRRVLELPSTLHGESRGNAIVTAQTRGACNMPQRIATSRVGSISERWEGGQRAPVR